MAIFIDYSEEEIKIFGKARKYFETLPPIDTDYYKNSFYDLYDTLV